MNVTNATRRTVLARAIALALPGFIAPSSVHGQSPQLVDPGIISTDDRNETFPALDPVEGSLWFSVYTDDFNRQRIMGAERADDGWAAPEVAPFSGRWVTGRRASHWMAPGSPSRPPDRFRVGRCRAGFISGRGIAARMEAGDRLAQRPEAIRARMTFTAQWPRRELCTLHRPDGAGSAASTGIGLRGERVSADRPESPEGRNGRSDPRFGT